MALQKNILSLFELTTNIQRCISANLNSLYWVKAELVKLNFYPQSGHCYPELVEKENNKIKAQLRGIIWRDDYKIIDSKFRRIANMQIAPGMQLLFQIQINYSPVYGLSAVIYDIDPTYTLGALAHEKNVTIERLKSEGVIDLNKKLPMPILPKRIAIISVESSKGYSDFMQTLNNYSDEYTIITKLFPAILQGDTAIPTLIKAFENIRKHANLFDVALLIRGGGGDVGLNCFDNYELARTIATFPIPVITGIGHSTDITISDMAAALSMKTPTEAANFILSQFMQFNNQITQSQLNILKFVNKKLENTKQQLNIRSTNLAAITKHYISLNNAKISNLSERVSRNIPILLNNHNKNINIIVENISKSMKFILNDRKNKLDNIENKIRLLNPENILKRGYSISYCNGQLLKSITEVTEDDVIETHLQDGKIISKTIKIINNE